MDDWIDQAACAGTDPDVFFPPADRHGWSPGPARRICAACPVRVECLTDAVDRREPAGIWAGAGGGLRRQLARARRLVEPGHGYRAGCGCVWCFTATRHFRWLDAQAADQVEEPVVSNGPGVTHGRRSTYARGCRCGRCLLAGSATRDLIRLCGSDVPAWWDATFGTGHGLSRVPSRAASEAVEARRVFTARFGPWLAHARHAAGLTATEVRDRLAAVGVRMSVERIGMVEGGAGDGGLSPAELAAVAQVLGVDLAGVLDERGEAA